MEKEKKKIYKRWWFWLIIIVLVVAIALSREETPKTTLTSGNATNSEDTAKTNKNYGIGEIYSDKNIAIKYVALNDDFTDYDKYATVKEGYKVIKAEFEFENVGNSDELASSYDFNCYADGYDCESFWGVDNSTFSSTLSAGKKTKGAVYFQVPKNATSVTLEYELNVWTSEKVNFIVK